MCEIGLCVLTMIIEILAILQSSQHIRLCKISNEIEKSSWDYYLNILTETLTEAVSCKISITEFINKNRTL